MGKLKFLMPFLVGSLLFSLLPLYSIGAAAEKEPIKIGASCSLTGKFAKGGVFYEMAWRIAVDQANAKGGVLGRPVHLLVEDDRSIPEEGVKIYEKFISRENIVAAFGPFTTAVTYPTSAITEKYGIPMISAGSATLKLYKRGFKTYFGIFPWAAKYIAPLVGVLDTLKPKPEKVAISYEKTKWGLELKEEAAKALTKGGYKVVFSEGYEAGTPDFTPILIKIKGLKPDTYLDIGHTVDEINIAKQSADIGFNPKVWIGCLTAVKAFGDALKENAEGVIGMPAWHDTARFPAPKDTILGYSTKDFVESFKKRYMVVDVDYHAGLAYASAQILFDAIKRAGSSDPKKIRDALADTKMITVAGPVDFDEEGKNIHASMLATQWQGGKVVVIGPAKAASEKPAYPKPEFK